MFNIILPSIPNFIEVDILQEVFPQKIEQILFPHCPCLQYPKDKTQM
jgi:hypothetical protein